MRVRLLALALLCIGPASALHALEFRSIAFASAVFFDGPSLKANKIFLVSRYYPVEVITKIGDWVKVRDAAGELAWVETRALSDKRMLLVIAPLAEIRNAPAETAAVVFRAEKNVVLELAEPPTSTWVKVRHRDGQTGYVRIEHIWGI